MALTFGLFFFNSVLSFHTHSFHHRDVVTDSVQLTVELLSELFFYLWTELMYSMGAVLDLLICDLCLIVSRKPIAKKIVSSENTPYSVHKEWGPNMSVPINGSPVCSGSGARYMTSRRDGR